jgi:hypothetical protein
MPAQAFADSKYFGAGDSSRMSDNEQASPSLRHSEVLRVKSSPGDAIPELNKRADDGKEVSASVARKEPRYILSDNPCGAALSNDPVHFPPERATVSNQAAALSCNAVVLARESSANNVNCFGGDGARLIGFSRPRTIGSPLPMSDCGLPRFPMSPVSVFDIDIMHILVSSDIGPVLS